MFLLLILLLVRGFVLLRAVSAAAKLFVFVSEPAYLYSQSAWHKLHLHLHAKNI